MEVVAQSGDVGVDVIAEIKFGVTLVREVVQAKRFKGTVQRKDLDALAWLAVSIRRFARDHRN